MQIIQTFDPAREPNSRQQSHMLLLRHLGCQLNIIETHTRQNLLTFTYVLIRKRYLTLGDGSVLFSSLDLQF